jgi:pyruvate, orthophosphate dikinase
MQPWLLASSASLRCRRGRSASTWSDARWKPNGKIVKEGDWISVDGTTGEVFLGQIPTIAPTLEEQTDLLTLLTWADEISLTRGHPQGSRGLADPRPAGVGQRRLPAKTPGAPAPTARWASACAAPSTCSSKQERLPIVQRMILSETSAKSAPLPSMSCCPHQRADFEGLFEAMDGYPVIIRLIDPPLHEFLPSQEELLEEVITMRVKGSDRRAG